MAAITSTTSSLFTLFVLLVSLTTFTFTVSASPVPLAAQVELLRLSGVSEREIEHSLNPSHHLPSAYPALFQSTTNNLAASLNTLNGDRSSLSISSTSSSSTTSYSEKAFEMVRKFMAGRQRQPSDDDETTIITGRMGEMRVHGE